MTEADPTVFVVDDDPSVRRSTERLVRSMGFNVQTFATAKEFTERARVENPSCLVLAHIVEKMEAESVAKLVRMAGQLGLSPGD